ncbi:hypothetical protein B0H13DRAFT_2269155 [Mycena leptocephala]|nr:hypothetical protein B0H13DRAFT_2269155 [Mycena leptocephala]
MAPTWWHQLGRRRGGFNSASLKTRGWKNLEYKNTHEGLPRRPRMYPKCAGEMKEGLRAWLLSGWHDRNSLAGKVQSLGASRNDSVGAAVSRRTSNPVDQSVARHQRFPDDETEIESGRKDKVSESGGPRLDDVAFNLKAIDLVASGTLGRAPRLPSQQPDSLPPGVSSDAILNTDLAVRRPPANWTSLRALAASEAPEEGTQLWTPRTDSIYVIGLEDIWKLNAASKD